MKIRERIGDTVATAAIGVFLVVGLTAFYVAMWGVGHLKKDTYHGRNVQ